MHGHPSRRSCAVIRGAEALSSGRPRPRRPSCRKRRGHFCRRSCTIDRPSLASHRPRASACRAIAKRSATACCKSPLIVGQFRPQADDRIGKLRGVVAMNPVCFVIMGFGKKIDLATGRELDLDKTYQNIIKPAVTDAGYECERADEILHSGVIDVPMYDRLFGAELVVADLSTANLNAIFELGIR